MIFNEYTNDVLTINLTERNDTIFIVITITLVKGASIKWGSSREIYKWILNSILSYRIIIKWSLRSFISRAISTLEYFFRLEYFFVLPRGSAVGHCEVRGLHRIHKNFSTQRRSIDVRNASKRGHQFRAGRNVRVSEHVAGTSATTSRSRGRERRGSHRSFSWRYAVDDTTNLRLGDYTAKVW